jgi:formamidopyrimidine-DNA glycosylase
MPELPEVQTVVNDLIRQKIIGKKIVKATLFWPKSIQDLTEIEFYQAISSLEIKKVERQGKYIVIYLDPFTLLIHLRMSGRLRITDKEDLSPHERVRFYLSDGRILQFIDQRKFGRLYLLKDPVQRLQKLGIDPLLATFTEICFVQLLNKKQKIKTLLLDQTLIAGLGNIYVDEALFEAKIHPEKLANQLTVLEKQNLHQAIGKVLRLAIENRGTSLGTNEGNFHSATGRRGKHAKRLKVYRRTGKPCFCCTTPIQRIKVNGRSTHFCPQCQPMNLRAAT